MTTKEIKAKLENVLSAMELTQEHKNNLYNIIIDLVTRVKSIETKTSLSEVETIEPDSEIGEVITTVNEIINDLKS